MTSNHGSDARRAAFVRKLKIKMGADPAAVAHPLYFTAKNTLVLVLQTEDVISIIYSEDDMGLAPGDAPKWTEPPSHLKNRDIVIIDSVNSGTGRTPKKDVYQQVLNPLFSDLGLSARTTYFKPTSADGIRQCAGSFDKDDNPLVIFISGDTSIGEFINGLGEAKNQGSELTVFNIPAGTGNSLALSLGIFSMADSVQQLLFPSANSRGETVALNLYEAAFPEGSYFTLHDTKTHEIHESLKFIVVLSWGFHASLVADSDTPEMRKHGVKRFQIAAGQNLANDQLYAGTTQLAANVVPGPYAYWILTPANKFEKTFEILPRGDIIDDNLFFISFNNEQTEDNAYIIDIMKKVYDNGKHIEDERVTYEQIKKSEEVTLTVFEDAPRNRRRFCLDGSIIQIPDGEEKVFVKSVGNWHKGRKFLLLQ